MAQNNTSIQGLKAAVAVPNKGTTIPNTETTKTQPGSPASYMGPDQGPFRCDNCEYYVDPGNCTKPEVLQEMGDADEDGYADVDAAGCCNFFEKK